MFSLLNFSVGEKWKNQEKYAGGRVQKMKQQRLDRFARRIPCQITVGQVLLSANSTFDCFDCFAVQGHFPFLTRSTTSVLKVKNEKRRAIKRKEQF